MPRLAAALLAAVLLAGCAAPPGPQGEPEALALLERARAAHGTDALDGATVTFSFRGTPFTLTRQGGQFRYERTLTDDAGQTVTEWVDNDGAHRAVGGAPVPLDDLEAARVATAVNSVAYFALLPAGFADPAVRARLLAPDTLAGAPYHRVEVTFAPEGGGPDWDDRYVVWLHATRATMDAFAYTYAVAPGDTARTATGSRFRTVLAARDVGGFRAQDYRTWTAPGGTLEAYGRRHAAGETFAVSDVVLDGFAVAR